MSSALKALYNINKLNPPKKFLAMSLAIEMIISKYKLLFSLAPHLVLSMILNHWLPGSHLLFLSSTHLHLFVTILLSESMSKQTLVPSSSLEDRCILESEIASHFELAPLQIIPSFAGCPNSSAARQKYVPSIVRVSCCV